jgi:hypothetical protein
LCENIVGEFCKVYWGQCQCVVCGIGHTEALGLSGSGRRYAVIDGQAILLFLFALVNGALFLLE